MEGGKLDGMKGDGEEEMGMEARGGEGGRAGRTGEWVWEVKMRFSISSMSDWEVWFKGTVSRSLYGVDMVGSDGGL